MDSLVLSLLHVVSIFLALVVLFMGLRNGGGMFWLGVFLLLLVLI